MANYLTDYKAGYLLNALVTNPNAAFFPWNCADFPYVLPSCPRITPRQVLTKRRGPALLCFTRRASPPLNGQADIQALRLSCRLQSQVVFSLHRKPICR